MKEEIIKQGKYTIGEVVEDDIAYLKAEAYQKQVDALYAYLDFQNKQVGIISNYVQNGGVISPALSKKVEEFQKKGLIAFEKYIKTQKNRIMELSKL